MNPSLKAIAVTLLAGVLTVWMTACSRDLPDRTSPTAPVHPRPMCLSTDPGER